MKRKLTAITLVCVLVIGMLAACGSKSDPIVGKWTLKEAKFGDMSMSAADLDLEFTIEFKADGTVELSAPEERLLFKFKLVLINYCFKIS